MKKAAYGSVVLLLACSLSIAAFAMPARPDQPRMQAAKADLQKALTFLNNASADKGGHRKNAIDLTMQAITAVNNGIEYDRTHFTPRGRNHSAFEGADSLPVGTSTDQPNMISARASLEAALENLNRASADKGGFREQAQSLIRSAIGEVNAGIEYDRTH